MMYIAKMRFWFFLIIAFLLGNATTRTFTTNTKMVQPHYAPRFVVPASNADAAAELYAKIYAKGGVWAKEEAEAAVMTIYGQPAP